MKWIIIFWKILFLFKNFQIACRIRQCSSRSIWIQVRIWERLKKTFHQTRIEPPKWSSKPRTPDPNGYIVAFVHTYVGQTAKRNWRTTALWWDAIRWRVNSQNVMSELIYSIVRHHRVTGIKIFQDTLRLRLTGGEGWERKSINYHYWCLSIGKWKSGWIVVVETKGFQLELGGKGRRDLIQ